MRRWTLIPWTAAAVLALAVLTAPAVKATSEDERPGEIGILAGVGFGDGELVGSDNDTDPNPFIGGRFAWHFTDRVAGYFDGSWVEYAGDAALLSDVSEYAVRLGPEWYFNPASRWQFFVNVGLGWMRLDSDFAGEEDLGFASLGLGVRRGWRPGALRFEFRADQTVTGADNFGGEDFTAIKALMGWTWGIGSKPKDSDEDGVFDKKDKCPMTPRGAMVDELGCPVDSDGDGVWNGLDQCPDTPLSWPVDAKGCPLDTDGDGVADGKDICHGTAKGCTVAADGCETDADGDGVCDGIDTCPNTPKGCRVEAAGCPVDSDRDGVCDGVDKCPGSASGVKVDATGCPPPPPPGQTFIPEAKKELVLDRVYFETNSAKLKPESSETLDKVAASLKGFPEVKIQVAGHTDSSGSDAHNMKLSDARATAVMNYLISKGVPPAMLSTKGYGETEPVADNKTPAGRTQNRRVGLRRVN